MAKIGVASLVSLVTLYLASNILLGGNPVALGLVLKISTCVLALAFVLCILKGLVLGFDSIAATAALNRTIGINVLILLTVFIIAQLSSCAFTLPA